MDKVVKQNITVKSPNRRLERTKILSVEAFIPSVFSLSFIVSFLSGGLGQNITMQTTRNFRRQKSAFDQQDQAVFDKPQRSGGEGKLV